MHYDMKRILCSTALAVVIGFAASNDAFAQGVVSLADDGLPIENNTASEMALFDEVEDSAGILETEPVVLAAPPVAPEATDSAIFPNKKTEESAPKSEGISVDVDNPLLRARLAASANEEKASGETLPGLIGEGELAANNNTAPAVGGIGAPATTAAPIAAPLGTTTKVDKEDLADKLIAKSNDTLFSQMSDLERQTTLLTLELRREKIRSDIEAIKAQRRRAEEEEKAYLEEKARKQAEWENEQKRLILIEEQKIIELEIAMEKERQERVVKAYKETMLQENQNWIKNNEKIYAALMEVEAERDSLYDNVKEKIKGLLNFAEEHLSLANSAKERHEKKVADLQLQVSILKARLEAAEAEKKALKNPFGEAENFMDNPAVDQPRLGEEYAVLEIRGQGDELVAKLMNKDKKTFVVKQGTILHTGHRIDEITRNFVRGELNGYKDFIYLSVGTAIEKEPVISVEKEIKETAAAAKQSSASSSQNQPQAPVRRRTLNVNRGIPSVSSGLMIK